MYVNVPKIYTGYRTHSKLHLTKGVCSKGAWITFSMCLLVFLASVA